MNQRKRSFLSLRAFCLILLLPLLLLLAIGSGLTINQSRAIINKCSHAHGEYETAQALEARMRNARKQIFQLLTVDASPDPAYLEDCRATLTALLPESEKNALRDTLFAFKKNRDEAHALLHDTSIAAEKRLAERLRLDAEALKLTERLLDTTEQVFLEHAEHGESDVKKTLRALLAEGRTLENRSVLLLIALALFIVFCAHRIKRQIIDPIESIRLYAGQLGTGVAVHSGKKSSIRTLSEITETLENLAVYLGQATVASEQIADERTRFKQMSLYDELTGLVNRRAFNDELASLWKKMGESGRPLGVIMLDVDKFKVYNDTFGHQAGDECLRHVAKTLARAVRASDVAARYGGEEFVALLPNADTHHALLIAERIREAVLSLKLTHPGAPTGYVSVSLGVASEIPKNTTKAQDLVHLADQALYRAKENGRNQSVAETNA